MRLSSITQYAVVLLAGLLTASLSAWPAQRCPDPTDALARAIGTARPLEVLWDRGAQAHILDGTFEFERGERALVSGMHTRAALDKFRKARRDLRIEMEYYPNGVQVANVPWQGLSRATRNRIMGPYFHRTLFPPAWSPAKIIEAIEQVVSDPMSVSRQGGDELLQGVVDGVRIEARVKPGRGIVTAYPTLKQ